MRRTIPIDPATAAALRARRRSRHISQNALALELGVSEATVSKWETARVGVSPPLVARIEAALERLTGRPGTNDGRDKSQNDSTQTAISHES
jgi:transcriptional regulator with XRE-family HTH domain